MVTLPSSRESLLVRVEFSNDAAWQQAKAAATATNEDGFCAYLHPVDDPSNQGASWEELVQAVPGLLYRTAVMFVVDREAMGAEYPILVVDLADDGRPPFRCVAVELWAVGQQPQHLEHGLGGVLSGCRTRWSFPRVQIAHPQQPQLQTPPNPMAWVL